MTEHVQTGRDTRARAARVKAARPYLIGVAAPVLVLLAIVILVRYGPWVFVLAQAVAGLLAAFLVTVVWPWAVRR